MLSKHYKSSKLQVVSSKPAEILVGMGSVTEEVS